MTKPPTRRDVELGLEAIRVYLDQTVPTVENARDRRQQLMQTGRDLGMTSIELGRLAGLRPVTVRKQTKKPEGATDED